MTNKRYTDEEIIKALEYCNADRNECNKCVFQRECESNPFYSAVAEHALDLINRQKSEIERLRAKVETRTQEKLALGRIYTQKLKTVKMGLSEDERLLMSNEDYKFNYKNKQQNIKKLHETSNKYNDKVILTNKKFIKLIDIIQTSIDNPNTDITYALDLLTDELQKENNRIESEKEYI